LVIHQAPSGHRDGRAAESALVAQSTFRRIEDEEGTEAALKAAIDLGPSQRGSKRFFEWDFFFRISIGFWWDFNAISMGFLDFNGN
jgi:hypothetical protein